MKKGIIIPCVILLICFLIIGIYIRDCIIFNSGIIIENFDEDFENRLLSAFDLGDYDYIELIDVYYDGLGIDRIYVVSFKVPKQYVDEFEELYLSERRVSDNGYNQFLPERDYTFEECKEYYPLSFDDSENYYVYAKEHTDKDYYEYHIKNNDYGSSPDGVWSLIHTYDTPFLPKNYRKIGHLKYNWK